MDSNILSEPLHLSRSEIGRFFSKVRVDPGTGCWNWTAGKYPAGYGQFSFRGQNVAAHRLMFAWLEHPLPPHNERELHHICHNRACVNPSHCELVTDREHTYKDGNSLQAINGLKTHCPKCGGEYTPCSDGSRRCLVCDQEYQRKWREANPEYYREYMRKWRAVNAEHHREYKRKYSAANREHINARARARYHAKKKECRNGNAGQR